jgi:hypothetical protein
MTQRATLAAHMHVEGFDQFHRESFDKRKVRAAMRKAGRVVATRAQLNLSLAGGAGNYPRKISGVLRDSIKMRVSRSGFMVKVMPDKTSGMEEYYPAYLHYGVSRAAWLAGRKKSAKSKGKRKTQGSAGGTWHVKPRANYVADALDDETATVKSILSAGFAAALR